MKLAVCDNDRADAEAICALVSAYGAKTGAEVATSAFFDADSLIHAVERGARYDVILLDILMPVVNGVEAARELRRLDESAELVFITVSPDFALDAFSVKARDYILKPVEEDTFFRLMDALAARLDEDTSVLIETKNGLKKLLPDRIEYCEALSHKLFYHLRSGAVIESVGTMQCAEEALAPCGLFLRAHRSYLVNINCIASFDRERFSLELESMTRVPVPKARFYELLRGYLARVKGGVGL